MVTIIMIMYKGFDCAHQRSTNEDQINYHFTLSLKEGSHIEIEPFTSDSMQLKVK
jgi:hypothetical protein